MLIKHDSMKNPIILFLLLISQFCMAQNKKEPIYYLNDIPISMDSVFIDPNSLQSIYVNKEKTGGEIYLTSKNQPWAYYRLDDLLKSTNQYSQIADKSKTPVFIINGKVINKMSDVKIDKSYFAKISLASLSNVSGLSAKSKKIVIVNIELTNKESGKELRIREAYFPGQDN